jgi:dipeptidase D
MKKLDDRSIRIKGGILQGKFFLNLDTEEDDEIDIGCAGGIDVTATAEYDEEETQKVQ